MYSIVRRVWIENWVENRRAVLVWIGTVLPISTLVALQAVVTPTLAFFALIIGGIAIGLCWTQRRQALRAAFLAGYLAYFFGSVAFGGGASLAAGYPAWRIAFEVAGGAFVGLIFGVVAGLWTVGGGALGTVLRRRFLVRHAP